MFQAEQIANLLCKELTLYQARYIETIQPLWNGYGALARFEITPQFGAAKTVIVKSIITAEFKADKPHPKGWNSEFAHQRKCRSYQVESHFYRDLAKHFPSQTAKFMALIDVDDNHQLIVMQDLATAGYKTRDEIDDKYLKGILKWLAKFHSKGLQLEQDADVWPQGSYWHLATRPDEHKAMFDGPLKSNADKISQTLNNVSHKTLLHGDAKPANFMINNHGDTLAVDFQYTGYGNPMVDVCYLFSSVLDNDNLERYADFYVAYYCQCLKEYQVEQAIIEQWSASLPFAWADLVRFLQGWSPEHYRLAPYALKQTELALKLLAQA
ncbi:phosphotransferase [Paraferrimonas sp. SM1919]|uniref:phosphotransferase n=1 Tax=Paraferrimonas sp. SM1919 TaxID=2662263 RepID=UPI0013D63864|nr:phosphotransferase [Paraferrimonas sp. SM1919]